MSNGFKSDDSKLYLGDNATSIYEKAVERVLKLFEMKGDEFYKEKAFYFMEKNKSAVLRQGMLESKAKYFANIPFEELDREREKNKRRIIFIRFRSSIRNDETRGDGFDKVL